MKIIDSYAYSRPGIKIAEHDLSGMIGDVQLAIASDKDIRSWRVLLSRIDMAALSALSKLFDKASSVNHLVVEQRDRAKSRDPSFSGQVTLSRMSSTRVRLSGIGPVRILP
ncbi:MAG: hypothetical protein SA339_01850 [Methanomassiliicoccus sp.]|nr:hypothetical protein [Methanomassiliicoccus sp.]